MNAKISVFVIYVKANIYLLLNNLDEFIFQLFVMTRQNDVNQSFQKFSCDNDHIMQLYPRV